MKLLTRNTDYAIRALCRLAAEADGLISAAEIAEDLRMPKPFMRKLMQELHKHGLLESHRGRDGGFRLASPPEKIFVYEVAEIFQGAISLNEHIFRGKPCPRQKKCNLKAKLDQIEKKAIAELKSITIASIMD